MAQKKKTIQLSDHFDYRTLMRFTVPSILMMVISSVYSIVDGLFVSNFAGSDGFAAVNLMMPIAMMISCIGFMAGAGGSALISKTLGEGKEDKARTEVLNMKRIACFLLSLMILLCGCQAFGAEVLPASDSAYIESVLNLANNPDQEWTYIASADAWTLSVVNAVAYPELPDQQGVSVCVPGAYVTGIDTNGDGTADITAGDAASSVKGALVIDYEAQIVSENGQTYSAATAPLIMTTGAAGYGSQNNSAASSNYASNGYIAISCGNRGKQDTATDAESSTYYTGDAPSCLVDQKAAARFVKYNILLGNLPGCADNLVVTGGSGGGAHAAMFAATSNNPDFYDYQIEAGAVGVYRNADGSYDTTVTIGGEDVALSDGTWGCVAYSAITSLYEADAAQAFEYYMDTTDDFNTPFQAQLAEYLSEAYMDYINGQYLPHRRRCSDQNRPLLHHSSDSVR